MAKKRRKGLIYVKPDDNDGRCRLASQVLPFLLPPGSVFFLGVVSEDLNGESEVFIGSNSDHGPKAMLYDLTAALRQKEEHDG